MKQKYTFFFSLEMKKIDRKCAFCVKFVFLLFSKAVTVFYVKPWIEKKKNNLFHLNVFKENVKSNKDFEEI